MKFFTKRAQFISQCYHNGWTIRDCSNIVIWSPKFSFFWAS